MGQLRAPPRVTPLMAMLAGNPAHFQLARLRLEELLGTVELASPVFPFDQTAYYTPAMGAPLHRQFFSFQPLADAGKLANWKLAANALEADLARTWRSTGAEQLPKRPINLDPGYVTGAKLVLASTKDFAHRLYLRDGIFAEITLSFRRDRWESHALTFPDFACGIYDDFLKQVRERHLQKIRHA